ncbi:hypothetical protein HY993_04345 [Candidatus Micrarchaeota archaeon]|nr:hypothetical protein [Candidatus Micrarchaeota archaeon]
MAKKKKINLFISFTDGFSKLGKIIANEKNGDIYLDYGHNLSQWHIHQSGQTQLKKLLSVTERKKYWIEPIEEQKNDYMHIEKHDPQRLNGVFTLVAPFHGGGLTVTQDKPKAGDMTIAINKKSSNELQLIFGLCDADLSKIREFSKLECIQAYLICRETKPNIYVGVREKSY